MADTPTTQAPVASKTKKYRVLRPVRHGEGKEEAQTYPVDGIIELADKHAEALLLQRAIEPATKEVAL